MKRVLIAAAIMLTVNTGLFLLAWHPSDPEWPLLWITGLVASLASALAAFMVGRRGLLLGAVIGVVCPLSVFGGFPLILMILTGGGIRALWSITWIVLLPAAATCLVPAMAGAYLGQELKRMKLRRSCTQARPKPRVALSVLMTCGSAVCLLGVVILWIVIIRLPDLGISAQVINIVMFLPIAYLAVMGLVVGIRQLRHFRK